MAPFVSRPSGSGRTDPGTLPGASALALAHEVSRVHPQDVGPLLGQATWLMDHPVPSQPSARWRRAWNLALGDSDSTA